ncbi:MAG: 30S ribosomal protein S17 [Candidatus Nanoarchaeia archaeon]
MAEKKTETLCTDRNCPFHGSLKARGQVFDGIVIGDKMQKTVKVEWPFLRYLPKYERYEKKRTRVMAHVPDCISVKTGDKVRIVECKPISKTVQFVVWEKL